MINATALRSALKDIYAIDDKYLVPVDSGWYVPTYDKNDKVGTWIGYRILSKKPISRAFTQGTTFVKSVKATFRLSFVGPQAEELADMTILWDDRVDVQKAFESRQIQINYDKRQMFSYPIKEGGLNDNLCWCVDFECQGFFAQEAKWERWTPKKVELGGKIITGGLNG